MVRASGGGTARRGCGVSYRPCALLLGFTSGASERKAPKAPVPHLGVRHLWVLPQHKGLLPLLRPEGR